LDEEIITLPQVLRDNSYSTLAFVTGPLLPETGLNNGFDMYSYRKKDQYFFGKTERYIIRQIKCAKEPWFVLVHLWEMHEPIFVRKSIFKRLMFSLFAKFRKVHLHTTKHDSVYKQDYIKGLSNIEYAIRSIVGKLKNLDLLIVLGDHGERLDELISKKERERCVKRNPRHGFNVYEYLLNVPLLFWGRDIPKMQIADLVRTIDVFPTILEYLKLGINHDMSGKSLWSYFKGIEEKIDRSILCSAIGVTLKSEKEWIEGIRSYRYKYTFKPNSPETKDYLATIENNKERVLNISSETAAIIESLKEKMREIKDRRPVRGSQKLGREEKVKIEAALKDLGYL
jgi:hypothetical protein